MVPEAGIEPARLAAGDFESPASTNFTTRADCEESDYDIFLSGFGGGQGIIKVYTCACKPQKIGHLSMTRKQDEFLPACFHDSHRVSVFFSDCFCANVATTRHQGHCPLSTWRPE